MKPHSVLQLFPLFAGMLLCSSAQANGFGKKQVLFALSLYLLPYVIGLIVVKKGERLRYAGMCAILFLSSLAILYGGKNVVTSGALLIGVFVFFCPWLLPFYGAILRFRKNA